jgi:hypothetical protein
MAKATASIFDYFLDPLVALFIFVIFLVGYLVFIDLEGGFSKKFLHFGPGTTPENTASFLGVEMNSWDKVILMYVVSFFAALVTQYYNTAVSMNLHSYVWNRATPVIPYSKPATLTVLFTEPILLQILDVIKFLTTLTLQLQFILPQALGSYIAFIPGMLARIKDKKFDPSAKK